jgi:hypothetical protein
VLLYFEQVSNFNACGNAEQATVKKATGFFILPKTGIIKNMKNFLLKAVGKYL